MITVYTTSNCPYCPTVKKYLNSKGVKFREVNVQKYPEIAQRLWDLGYRTTPITSDGQTFVTGANFGKIAKLIKEDTNGR